MTWTEFMKNWALVCILMFPFYSKAQISGWLCQVDGRHYFTRQNIKDNWQLTEVECEAILMNPAVTSKGPKSRKILLSGVGGSELDRGASLVSTGFELKMRQHER
jgi:hypothetical protein